MNNDRKIWFSSDTHYNHSNVIRYCNRPFSSADEMDEAMIKNWNSVVKDGDIVYFLGDFAFYKDQQRTVDTLRRLNGAEVHLVLGNHDRHMKGWVRQKFTSAQPYLEIKVPDNDCDDGEQFIVLCHYSFRVFNKSHRGAWNLYGHSHNTLPDDPNIRSLDVGVDAWNYTPVSYEQIKERMKLKKPLSVDHHKVRDI